ncbi:MAG: hypothetical protein GY820_44860 [Gammaproteobacteria bacterium]|nr:hypothetical protein [Gammaproteobacteria bacterium]
MPRAERVAVLAAVIDKLIDKLDIHLYYLPVHPKPTPSKLNPQQLRSISLKTRGFSGKAVLTLMDY